MFSSCSIFKLLKINKPPEKPSNPFPEDISENIEIENLTLKWNCSDPDNDSLKYHVFFGKEKSLDSLDLMIDDLKESSFKTEILENETDYYWKIIVFDGEFNVESDIWHFKTKPFFPDWWSVQDNPDYIYSFGKNQSKSQLTAKEQAFDIASKEKNKYIKKYIKDKIDIFISESMITNPKLLKMSDQLIAIVSNTEFENLKYSRQVTTSVNYDEYETFIRIDIPKKSINKKLYEKIILAKKLFEELQYSDSFQKFIREHVENE